MLKKVGVNVVWCVAFLSAVGAINCPPLAGVQGVEPLSVPSADQGGIDFYTKLMLHADGSDQGTSFTDSSSGAKTVTNTESYDSHTKLMLHMENNVTDSAAGKTVTNNNATFTSSVYKMGGYSGVFNGSNAYLSLADSDDWNFGTGDFTIDFWWRSNVLPTEGQFYGITGQHQDANNFWRLVLAAVGSSHYWNFNYKGGSVILASFYSGTFTVSTNTWYHDTIIRKSGVYYFFHDGAAIGSNSDYTSQDLSDIGGVLTVGAGSGGSALSEYLFNGWLDELRISKGIARWTSDFTPPSSPYGKVATVTSQKKFGTASGEFKGSGEYLSLADSDELEFWIGRFYHRLLGKI